MPTDNAVDLALADEPEHLVEDRTVACLLRRSLLDENVILCHYDALSFCEFMAELQLVGNGLRLLVRTFVGRATSVDTIALGDGLLVLGFGHALIVQLRPLLSDSFSNERTQCCELAHATQMGGDEPIHQLHAELTDLQDTPFGSCSHFGIARLRCFDLCHDELLNRFEQGCQIVKSTFLSHRP